MARGGAVIHHGSEGGVRFAGTSNGSEWGDGVAKVPMIVQTPAIVLKSFPYSETSLTTRCFTREMGRINLLVRGARRKKAPLAAYFQPANYLDLIFYYKETRELQTISKAGFVETWPRIRDDLKKITYSLAAIELTDRTVTDHDPHRDLFDKLVQTLRTFNDRSEQLNLVFWHYEIQLLKILGFQPDFEKRDFPGLRLPDPYSGPNSRTILNGLQRGTLESLPKVTVTARDRKVISEYLSLYLQYHFEGLKNLKSFSVIKQILT